MTSKHVGNISEIECIAALIRLGYVVSLPYGDCARYDFIVDIDGKLLKIQVKTAHPLPDGAGFGIPCRSINKVQGKQVHKSYTKEEIDGFMTYFDGKCYYIPVEECGIEKKLRFHKPINNQTARIYYASQYLLEHQLEIIHQN